MNKIHIFDIEGTEFPAGRRTRVIMGEAGVMSNGHFCQGYVVVYPGGKVPVHSHGAVETYTILKGRGIMKVGNEEEAVAEGDTVYIESGQCHGLVNTGSDDLHMMFVYAPDMAAEHWAQESGGKLK